MGSFNLLPKLLNSQGKFKKPPPSKPRPSVAVPYAPTPVGRRAERAARGSIAVPYAPTSTGKSAERAATKKRVVRAETKALAKTKRTLAALTPPGFATFEAKGGVAPPAHLRKVRPKEAKIATSLYAQRLAKGEPIHADPLAEFGLDTVLTAGLGGLAGAAGRAGESAVADTLESAAARITSKEATAGEVAAEKGATGAKALLARASRGAKGAEQKVATKIKHIEKTEPKRVAAAGKMAKRHPLRSSIPVNAGAYPAGVHTGLTKRSNAAVVGTVNATIHHPGEVAATTGRGLLGAFVVPWDIGKAGFNSATEGSTKPLTSTSADLVKGAVGMGKKLFSGNQKAVEDVTRHELGLIPETPFGAIGKAAKDTEAFRNTRGAIRDYVESKRAPTREARIKAEGVTKKAGERVEKKRPNPLHKRAESEKPIRHAVTDRTRPKEKYVFRRFGERIEKNRGRHYVAREVDRTAKKEENWTALSSKPTFKELKKADLSDDQNSALRIFTRYGVPFDEKKGLAFVKAIHDGFPKPKEDDPTGTLDRHATKWILAHPDEVFHNEHFQNAIHEFDKQSLEIAHSVRNRHLAANRVENVRLKAEGRPPILKPEERIPADAEQFLPKSDHPHSRTEAIDIALEREHALRDLRKGAQSAERKAGQLRADLRQRERVERIRQRRVGSKTRDIAPGELRRTDLPVSETRAVRPALKSRGPNKGDLRLETSRALEAKRAALVDADAHSRAARAEATRIERDQRGLMGHISRLMKPPERGGPESGVSSTHAVAYTPQMEHDFDKEMRASYRERGYRVPSPYVADKMPTVLEPDDVAAGIKGSVPLNKIWPNSGKAAASGNAEADFTSVFHHSMANPRYRASVVQSINRLFSHAKREFPGSKPLMDRAEVEHAILTHKAGPDIAFIRPQLLKNGILEGRGKDIGETVEEQIERAQDIGSADGPAQLHKALDDAEREGTPGEKFVPVSSTEIHEYLGHMESRARAMRGVAATTNAAGQAILNSPAFLQIRFTHEIPAFLALGKAIPAALRIGGKETKAMALRMVSHVTNVDAALKNLDTISTLPPEVQADMAAIYGTSPGFLGDPAVRALHAKLDDPIKAAAPTPVWKRFWHVVSGKTGGEADKWRTALSRQTIGGAKLERDFKIASKGLKAPDNANLIQSFTAWRRSAHNIFRDEEQAVKDMQGMDYAERAEYITNHPSLGDKLMKNMHSNAGNFTSFTVLEKQFAPLTLFYSFQRYTVLWTLYHFPLDHPVVATALNWLGQANYQRVKEATSKAHHDAVVKALKEGKAVPPKAEPSFLEAGYGYVDNGNGNEEVLPAALRADPALSTIQKALVSGKPSQIISELPPQIQILITAADGTNPYTGEPIEGSRLVNAAREALSAIPYARLGGLTKAGEEQSALSKAFEHTDPLREQRSVVTPFIGQTIKQLAEEESLNKGTEGKYNTIIPPKLDSEPSVVEAIEKGGPALKKAIKEAREYKSGSAYIKAKEEPYFPKHEKGWGKLQFKRLGEIEEAAGIDPFKSSKKTKTKAEEFGLPASSSSSRREAFGLPSTSSSTLKEQFGIP